MTPLPKYRAPDYMAAGKLLGKVALITGGDSGIGRAVAVLFAKEGADIAIGYLPAEQSDAEVTKACVEQEGRRVVLVPGDVADAKYCKAAVERTVKELGQLDILVNNAAYQMTAETIEELTEEQWERTFRLTLAAISRWLSAPCPTCVRGRRSLIPAQ